MPSPAELRVKTLGERSLPSTLNLSTIPDDEVADFVPDEARVLVRCELLHGGTVAADEAFEKAGPRERIYFDPTRVRAAIVTCGGLCPGLNNVIRAIVLELHFGYGVRDVLGYRYGYQGLSPVEGNAPVRLGPDEVRSAHQLGGSMLGTSRGSHPVEKMVDALDRDGVDVLFALGGDGTLRGAHALQLESERRGRRRAIVGVPKTIDNDVLWVDRTFGFDTAVEVARGAIDAAHVEAVSAHNGIGLVKLMGRDAGFVAAHATLASTDVNFCLVPEVHFDLEGDHGLLAALERRLGERAHAVVVVAEGCGRALLRGDEERDASGNVRYASLDADIGLYLKERLGAYFKSRGVPISLKYIDPSYMIRSVTANAADSVFCDILGRHAVHAAMAGKTDLMIGNWHDVFTHVPLSLTAVGRKVINPDSGLWLGVTATTGQPSLSNVAVSRRAPRGRG